MQKLSNTDSIDQIVRAAAEQVVDRAAASITRAISLLVADKLERKLRAQPAARARRGRVGGTRRRRAGRSRIEITKWTADRRARRVPNFVIEATGLDTKKKIVAKYGEGVTFEKGKAPKEAARVVKVRPPIVRRKVAAT
jgi:hypothetical protein